MGSCIEDDECRFFDAQEDIASMSDSNCDSIHIFNSNSSITNNPVEVSFLYDVWNQTPRSVIERRSKFLKWMGLSLDQIASDNSIDVCSNAMEEDSEKIKENNGSDNPELEDSDSKKNFIYRDRRIVCNVDKVERLATINEDLEACKNRLVIAEESENTCSPSLPFNQVTEMEDERANNLGSPMKRANKKGWLDRLRPVSCIFDADGKSINLIPGDDNDDDDDATLESRFPRVKVRQCKKQLKELSALYMTQNFQAHEGEILTMKFSPDGKYLASGGEDGIVRLWEVMEDERSNETDLPELDSSCDYFTTNHLSELKPLFESKEKIGNSTSLRKTSESACVVFPTKIFRILEKPLHEFYGHNGEILDLSWSNKNFLLSSSVDKTVRLWHVGSDHCLNVFSHSNYVTCVQFNPVDNNYFISGSIDGKVRIWEITHSQVVDWADIREIVTAVCYRPDGKGGILGTMKGNCRFFDTSDNHLQFDVQVCLHGNKKSTWKKITGFQFFPQDSSKVMVTCADSRIRILHGRNVIGKYKGLRNSGNQISASFSSDGKHIISACDNSNVYLWNCNTKNDTARSQPKKTKSYEHFSTNASIAIPWCGLRSDNSNNDSQFHLSENFLETQHFSLSQECLEPFPKGSATWPEEKLPPSSPRTKLSRMHKSHIKFLKKSCQSESSCHAWGLVIVTAGRDGRIRSFHNYGLPVPT